MVSEADREVNGSLYGILPEFRSQGLAKYIFMFMHNFCLENNFNSFNIDVGITNTPSQQASLSSGMKLKEVLINIYLYPLLSKTISTGTKVSSGNFNEADWLSANMSECKRVYQCKYKTDSVVYDDIFIVNTEAMHFAVFLQRNGEVVKSISILN